jgi:membrane protein
VTLIRDVESAINRIWGLTEKRLFLPRLVLNLMFLLCLPLGTVVFLSLVEAKLLYIGQRHQNLPGKGFMFVFVILMIVYKWMPIRKVGIFAAGTGALVAAAFLYVEQAAFGFVTSKVFDYSNLYGSLAVIPVFLIWILVVWYIILFGASISASFYKETKTAP